MEKILPLKTRLEMLDEIKTELSALFGRDLLAAIVYGSTLCEDFCATSDIDILLVFNKANLTTLTRLKKLIKKHKQRGFPLDINIHNRSEMPEVRGDVFWHNNRGLYMQKEISIYGTRLLGNAYFTNIKFPDGELEKECVKLIHSFKYQVRKLIIKERNSVGEIRQAIKFCLYSTFYFLAYHGIFPNTKLAAYRLFDKKCKLKIRAVDFYKMKINRPSNLTHRDLALAFSFLDQLDNLMFKRYLTK